MKVSIQSTAEDEERLWQAPDESGTNSLFDVSEASVDNASDTTSVDKVEIVEQLPRYEYPVRMIDLQRQYRARSLAQIVTATTAEVVPRVMSGDAEDQRDTPYSELGGGLGRDIRNNAAEGVRHRSLYENMDSICRDYQPWMRDITIGVERYDLLNLTAADVKVMSAPDQRKMALYVEGYRNGLASIRRLVNTHEGIAEYHSFFDKYRVDGVAPSPDEFKSYMATLSAFEAVLAERGAMQYLVDYAKSQIRTGGGHGRLLTERERGEARKRNKDKKGNTPRIRRDNKLQRHVVELIPRGGAAVPEPY